MFIVSDITRMLLEFRNVIRSDMKSALMSNIISLNERHNKSATVMYLYVILVHV